MDERSAWIGVCCGFISCGALLIFAVINNYYAQEFITNKSLSDIAKIIHLHEIDYFVLGGSLLILGIIMIIIYDHIRYTPLNRSN